MNRKKCTDIIHYGTIQEKAKMDAFIIDEAREWIHRVAYIDNIIANQTVAWSEEERDHLDKTYSILDKKRRELAEFQSDHYGKMLDMINDECND